jgi:hypothetical protein
MKFLQIFFVVCFFINAHCFYTQTSITALKLSFLKPVSVSLAPAITLVSGQTANAAEFLSLVKVDSPILHTDLSLYTKPKHGGKSNGGELAIALAFKIINKAGSDYRERALLRVGVNFCTLSFLSSEYEYIKANRFDTLSGSSTTIFLDSFYTYRYRFAYDLKLIGLDASLLFCTNTTKNFALYGGITVAEYFSLSSVVNVRFKENIDVKQTNLSGQSASISGSNTGPGAGPGNSPALKPVLNMLDAKSCFITRFSIPVGVTLRLAKTKAVLKNIQLFFESRPGIGIATVIGYKTFVHASMTSQIGLKVLIF